MKKMGALAVVVATLVACGSSGTSEPAVAMSQAVRETAPTVAPGDASALRDGNAAFAFDMQHALAKSDENLVFSPHSISLALAMTSVGARGTTASELASALHFTLPPAQLHPAFDALDLVIASRGPVTLATSLWGSPTVTFEKPFLDALATSYGAGVRLTDFAQAETARTEINGWVGETTHEKIRDLLPTGSIDAGTKLVLVNAIYFKAAWQTRFDASATAPGPFHAARGDVNVPLMHGRPMTVPYATGEGYQAVSLPYEGGALSMVAILPDNLGAFEPTLDTAKWQQIVASLHGESVAVTMPKVKIDGGSIALADTLKARGMPTAFSDSADFSGITTEPVKIAGVYHQAFLAIDEEGSEAAAATAVVLADAGAFLATVPPIQLAFDRPFVFAIRDDATGAILFLGHVATP